MILKGAYAAGTSYSVGDVVKYQNVVYLKQKASKAGVPPTNTRYWGRLDQLLAEAVSFVLNGVDMAAAADQALIVDNLTSTDKKKVLSAKQGKALKDLVDGLDTEVNALQGVVIDSKTVRLASSTASSEKIFDITVDDDGDLTATEYTPPAAAT